MACNNNGCSGGCYGALNCISGPLTHCGHCAGDGQYFQNYPFYTGPCPAAVCSGCGCSNPKYPPYPWNGCCSARVTEEASRLCGSAAHFSASSPLMTAGGEGIDLTPTACMSQEYFACTDGGVLIRKPGSYLAVYSLIVPPLHAVSTRLMLTLNGSVIDPSVQDVTAVADAASGSYTGHLLFQALPNSLLRLVTTGDLNLCPAGESIDLAKLTLLRL